MWYDYESSDDPGLETVFNEPFECSLLGPLLEVEQ
jgi:hypothetical protein